MKVIVNGVQKMQEPRVTFLRQPKLQWSLYQSTLCLFIGGTFQLLAKNSILLHASGELLPRRQTPGTGRSIHSFQSNLLSIAYCGLYTLFNQSFHCICRHNLRGYYS